MTNNVQTVTAPSSLIEALGTGEDTQGLIGKRIRLTRDPMIDAPKFLIDLLDLPESIPVGTEAVVTHIDSHGEVWGDFGDNELLPLVGEEQRRVYGLGFVGGDGEAPQMFEVIED